MSRYYAMDVTVDGVEPDEAPKVFDALMGEWGFEEDSYFYYDNDKQVTMNGESNLCGGEGEDEFTTRISHAIWKEVGRFVEVTVRATFLEELPYETYCMDEDDYNEWAGNTITPEEAEESFKSVRNADQVLSVQPAGEFVDEPIDESLQAVHDACNEGSHFIDQAAAMMGLAGTEGMMTREEAYQAAVDEEMEATVEDRLREHARMLLEFNPNETRDFLERTLFDTVSSDRAVISRILNEILGERAVDVVMSIHTDNPPKNIEARIEKYRKPKEPKKPKRKLNIPEVNDEKAQYTWGKESDPWESSEEDEGGETETT